MTDRWLKGDGDAVLRTLVGEHRRIEALLDTLERMGEAVERGEDLPRPHLCELTALLKAYADAHHHRKEEEILFRAMVAAGLSDEEGPVAFMLEQHDEGRDLVSRLGDLAEGPPWSAGERAQVARLARDFAILLRAHIRDEDDVVYPLAVARLRPAAWADVTRACAQADAEATEVVTNLTRRADALVQLYATATRPAIA
ncbi:MAG: hemerythrin domain-containing protein [Myxococcales bacterium]|nr:hemerythrin domain-containing protein [Myxococcales bacterium]